MWHFEVIFAKSFLIDKDGFHTHLKKKGSRMVISTITEVVQSAQYKLRDAINDANNKIEKHPLAKAGWYWSPPQQMSRKEVQEFRQNLRDCHLADFEIVQ
jgi:hypothetical protein